MSGFHSIDEILEGELNFCPVSDWKNKLKKRGFNEENISVIGYPTYDELYNKLKNYSIRTRSKVSKIHVVLVTTPMHEHGYWSKSKEFGLISDLITLLTAEKKYEITIKIHPSSSSLKEYRDNLKHVLSNVKILQKEDLFDVLRESDVMVTYGGSPSFFYGVLTKKPLIYLNVFNDPLEWQAFPGNNISIECNNRKELVEKINEVFNKPVSNEKIKEFIEKYMFKFDGKSSERMVDGIIKLIDSNISKSTYKQ
jgi:UDP-N-acetylglucosamine 2-epimerase